MAFLFMGALLCSPPMLRGGPPGPPVGPSFYVSPEGDDRNGGQDPAHALRTPGAAVARAAPGTTVLFAAGTYPPLRIVGKSGVRGAPITFAALPGMERRATFTTGRRDAGVAVSVEGGAFIVLRGLRAAGSQKGIDVLSSSQCAVLGGLVEDLGQEGIHVGRLHGVGPDPRFLGPASAHVRVVGNTVRATGKVLSDYGEGIYVGTGAEGGDDTHDVLIADNTLTDIAAEGVELKPGTHDVTVRGNEISDTHHRYNAAVTVAVEGTPSRDGNFLIEGNRIWDVKRPSYGVAGIAIGHGNAVIRNNIIWSVEGGVGIRVFRRFSNPRALSVRIENNTVWCGPGGRAILLNDGTGGLPQSPLLAVVDVKDTYTADGSAGSSLAAAAAFVGPLTGAADAGQGPGSGFRLKVPGRAGAVTPSPGTSDE